MTIPSFQALGSIQNSSFRGGGQFQLNSLITVICINCTLHQRSLFFLRLQIILGLFLRHEVGLQCEKLLNDRASITICRDFFVYCNAFRSTIRKDRRLHIYELAFHYAWFDCQNFANFEFSSLKAIAERHSGYDSPCYAVWYGNLIIFGVGVSHCLSRQGGNARPWQWDKWMK